MLNFICKNEKLHLRKYFLMVIKIFIIAGNYNFRWSIFQDEDFFNGAFLALHQTLLLSYSSYGVGLIWLAQEQVENDNYKY